MVQLQLKANFKRIDDSKNYFKFQEHGSDGKPITFKDGGLVGILYIAKNQCEEPPEELELVVKGIK